MNEQITGEQGVLFLTESVVELEDMVDTLSLQIAEYEAVLRWYSLQYSGVSGPAQDVLKKWNAALTEQM